MKKLFCPLLFITFSLPLLCVTVTSSESQTTSTCSGEELYQAALKLHTEKDYHQAFPLLKEAAEKGNADAQYSLGIYFRAGFIGDKDPDQAHDWFLKAAEQEHSEGKYYIALIYISSNEQDKQKIAIDLFHDLAQIKHSKASFELGKCYQEGIGVVKNIDSAKHYYVIAAEKGSAPAMNKLGQGYANGTFSVQFSARNPGNNAYTQAEFWLEKSAQKEDPEGLYLLAKLGIRGTQYGPRSLELLTKAASKGHAPAHYDLGEYYSRKQEVQAFAHFQKAAELEHREAQFKLALYYHNGLGTTKNIKEAEKYYLLAAEKNHLLSQKVLAGLYENGHGISIRKDNDKALKWHEQAAIQGDEDSQLIMAEHYAKSDNHEAAKKWYEIIAKRSDIAPTSHYRIACYYLQQNNQQQAFLSFKKAETKPESFSFKSLNKDELGFLYYMLGGFYLHGKVTAKDKEKAIYYYKLSSENNYKLAEEILLNIHSKPLAKKIQLFDSNLGEDLDISEIIKYLEAELQRRNAEAAALLGRIHKEGYKVEQNFEKACEYFEQAYNCLRKSKTSNDIQ